MSQPLSEVQAAYSAGFLIECLMPMTGRWHPAPIPSWDPDLEYRVAPDQNKELMMGELAEWRKLCHSNALHASLLSGMPARLEAAQLRHLLGNKE